MVVLGIIWHLAAERGREKHLLHHTIVKEIEKISDILLSLVLEMTKRVFGGEFSATTYYSPPTTNHQPPPTTIDSKIAGRG